MVPKEIASWIEFYKLFPFDDYHRFYRPAALVAGSMSGTDLDDLLAWLERRFAAPMADSDLSTLAAFGLKPPRRPLGSAPPV